jgi:hypothetical protein
MFKPRFVVLSLIAAALLCWQILPANVDTVTSGIIDPCSTTATGNGGCYLVCPQGDGDLFTDVLPLGAVISLTVKDALGAPQQGIPATDFWLIGCNDSLLLCGGGGSIGADSATNEFGQTTITGAMAASGCDMGLNVVVQGNVIMDGTCTGPLCLNYTVRSPDFTQPGGVITNPDGDVNFTDFVRFSDYYPSASKPFIACLDFNCGGTVEFLDFVLFADHYTHSCNP